MNDMYYRALDQQDLGPCPRSVAAYAMQPDGTFKRVPLSQDAFGFQDNIEEAELRREDAAARQESETQHQDRERNQ